MKRLRHDSSGITILETNLYLRISSEMLVETQTLMAYFNSATQERLLMSAPPVSYWTQPLEEGRSLP